MSTGSYCPVLGATMEPQGAIAEMLFENSGTLRRTIGEEVEEKEEEEAK